MAFRLSLVPVGRVSPADMDDLARRLSDQGWQVTILPEREVPPEAYDAGRQQYRAAILLELVRSEAGDRVLAVETERGILLTPYAPDTERALKMAAKAAKKYRNALRELAK